MLKTQGCRQKESLSEYGSEWEWEYNYPHAFSQDNPKGTPYRLSSNGSSFDVLYDFCENDIEVTNGQLLSSNTQYVGQLSCRPNTGNAGKYYNWYASTVDGKKTSGNESNSICPRGWQLTVAVTSNPRSYDYLFVKTYGLSTSSFNDSSIRNHPMSIIRTGQYFYSTNSTRHDRGEYGFYWSSRAQANNTAYSLRFRAGGVMTQYGDEKNHGNSVRCVSR